MAVRIGSARIDERGKITGGKAGSQIAKEISRQDWYLHSKGWVVLRAIDEEARELIAQNMEYACDSDFVGYDQSQNQTLYQAVKNLGFDISKLETMCETDCARLVRVCVRFAGIECGDFYTGTLVKVLEATGKFKVYKSAKYCESSDYLRRGDILVTRTKGHTVVVLSDGAKVYPEYKVGKTYTLQQEMNIREGAGLAYEIKKRINWTASGRKHDKDKDSLLDKGTVVTCQKLKKVGTRMWMKIPSGWVCAYNTKTNKIYIK
jgi:hypothetical protein